MKANAVLIDSKDNVVTVVRRIKKGEEVTYFYGGELRTICSVGEIPEWNKMSIADLAQGDEIIKYGEFIGVATENIPSGEYTSHLNIKSLPRNYTAELK